MKEKKYACWQHDGLTTSMKSHKYILPVWTLDTWSVAPSVWTLTSGTVHPALQVCNEPLAFQGLPSHDLQKWIKMPSR